MNTFHMVTNFGNRKLSILIVYITLANELFMGKCFITLQGDHCYLSHNIPRPKVEGCYGFK